MGSAGSYRSVIYLSKVPWGQEITTHKSMSIQGRNKTFLKKTHGKVAKAIRKIKKIKKIFSTGDGENDL